MFSGSLPNNWKTVIYILFSIVPVTANLFEIWEMFPATLIWEHNIKCFPSILVWPIQVLLTFLGNSQWKLAKHLKNSDFYSSFYSTTCDCQLVWILEMLPGICLEYRKKSFPQFWYGQSKSIKILGNVQWQLANQLINSDFYSIFHYASVTANLFEILEMLLAMCLTYRIKCFPLILV